MPKLDRAPRNRLPFPQNKYRNVHSKKSGRKVSVTNWGSTVLSNPRSGAGTVAYWSQSHARPSKEACMKNRWMVIGVAGVSVLLGGATAADHSYNPIKWT